MHEYQRVKDGLLRQIRCGKLAPRQQIAPVRQLSKDLGISLVTVHRAVRELIQEGHLIAHDRQGVFVSDVQFGKDSKVGLLLAMPVESMHAGNMFGPLFTEVQRRLLQQGAAVVSMECMQSTPTGTLLKPLASIASLGLRGAILVRILDLPYIASLVQLRLPIVATDVDATDAGAHSVTFDNLGSAFALTRHLIARGHKRILFVGGVRKSSEGDDRWRYDMVVKERGNGFRLALEGAGLASDLQVYCAKTRHETSFREAVDAALAQREPFTAVVADSLLPVRNALHQAGRDDLEVVGWVSAERDPEPLLQGSVVGLAVCDFTALGELAVATLEASLEQPGGAVRLERLKPRLLLAPAGAPAGVVAGGSA